MVRDPVKSKAKRAKDVEVPGTGLRIDDEVVLVELGKAGGIAPGCLNQQPFAGFAFQSPQTCSPRKKFLSTEF